MKHLEVVLSLLKNISNFKKKFFWPQFSFKHTEVPFLAEFFFLLDSEY